jgi:transposase
MDHQTTCKNAMRSLLRAHGRIPPKGLWTKKGLARLRQEEMPTVAASMDNAKRFLRSSQVGAYFGLVPQIPHF